MPRGSRSKGEEIEAFLGLHSCAEGRNTTSGFVVLSDFSLAQTDIKPVQSQYCLDLDYFTVELSICGIF